MRETEEGRALHILGEPRLKPLSLFFLPFLIPSFKIFSLSLNLKTFTIQKMHATAFIMHLGMKALKINSF